METQGRERRQKTLSIDRLSELPDSLLCHILSFLPTRTSVSTSILSTRWRSLWNYVPNLHFERVNQHIVTRMLWRYKLEKLPSLQSLTILLPDCRCDDDEVETWIIFATDFKVPSLHLSVLDHKLLPFRLFTCETLVDLSICDCGEIRTLDRVRLPRLKKLYLKCVEFEDDESLPRLLSGCTALEYLRIESNFKFGLTSWCISSPTLKWLRLQSLLVRSSSMVEMNTPALEYLSVDDYLSCPIECGDLKSLIAAEICQKGEILCGVFLLKFFDSLSNVKSLKLDLSDCAMVMSSLLSAWTPSFDNLTKLELTADSSFLSKLLDSANGLEILIFDECSVRTEGWIEPEQVPKCLLSRLRTVKICNILCTEDGLKIVRYLLKNARVLKRMDITYPWSIGSEAENDLVQKVSLFERVSKSCELTFTEASSKDFCEGFLGD